ncbi:MAG: hypothetical protein N3A66_09400, partial [Planctomycetota bacterium]|nr:hypothetical protein [Planctomycetota bacterium]
MGFRYCTSGNWYKGNTHIHSTVSDGGKSFRQIAELYRQQGYDFLFRTDHWVASDVSGDTEPQPLLWLDGIELDGNDRSGALYHVICLGNCLGLRREMGLLTALEMARSRNALLILAHPFWCGNSLEDVWRYGFHGVEIYNHVCRWLNGKSDGRVYWCAMLARQPDALAIAADDAHLRPEHPGWNGGWISVNAPACTPNAIME